MLCLASRFKQAGTLYKKSRAESVAESCQKVAVNVENMLYTWKLVLKRGEKMGRKWPF